MAPRTKPPTLTTPFAGLAGGSPLTNKPGAVAERYLTTPSLVPTPTHLGETPIGAFASPNPTEMASAWGLPPNVGALRLPSGVSVTHPATGKARTRLSQGMSMLELYGKLADPRASISAADLNAAEQIGGPVARAAELVRAEHPSTTPRQTGAGISSTADSVGGTERAEHVDRPAVKKARAEAVAELGKRLTATLGLSPKDLSDLTAKAPRNLVSQMQNAGYAVTSRMTLGDAIGAMTKSSKNAEIPSPEGSRNLTVAQYIQSLTDGSLSRTDLEHLQKALYMGGFYDSDYYEGTSAAGAKNYTRGQLTAGTMLAFRSAILQTLTESAKGKHTSLAQVIGGGIGATGHASTVLGTGATGSLTGAKPTTPVPMATPQELQSTLETAMENYLGRLPTQQELSQFTQYYSGLMAQGSKTLLEEGENPGGMGYVTYQTGIPYLPKVPTASQAAEQWTQNANSTEYHARNIADAYGMLMNLVDRQNVSAYTTPGEGPQRVN